MNIEISPARKNRKEMTPAKMGRSMKKRDRFILVFLDGRGGFSGRGVFFAGIVFLRSDKGARANPLHASDDDAVAIEEALEDGVLPDEGSAQHDLPVGDLVFQ